MDMTNIIYQMVILFLIMGIGYGATKAKLLSQETNKTISKLVVYISNPALIINSVTGSTVTSTKQETLGIILLSITFFIVLPILAKLICIPVKLDRQIKQQYQAMLIFTNCGFMGIPVINAIYGASAIFYVSIILIPFNILIFTYGIMLLSSGEDGTFDVKKILNPGVIASFVALAIYFLDIPTHYIIDETASMVGAMTTPLAMIFIGSSIAKISLKEVFFDIKIYLFSFIKLIIMPLIIFFLYNFFVEDKVILGIFVIIAGMPVAANVALLNDEYGAESKLISKGIVMSTFLSLLSIPLLTLLLR